MTTQQHQAALARSAASTRRRKRLVRHMAGRGARYFASLVVAVVLIGPVVWMALTTLEPPAELASHTLGIDFRSLELGNYNEAIFGIPGFGRVDLSGGLVRSFLTASIASLISLNVSAMAAYALTRFSFRGRRVVSLGVLSTQAVPAILLVVPLFSLLQGFGLTNTLQGLLLVYTAITLPFSTILLRGYFATLPSEIEQAGLIDGCGYLGILFRLVYPLALPAFVAVFIFDFLSIWNEFLFAFILSGNFQTLTVTLYGFSSNQNIYWGPLLAGAVLATIPALVIFLPLQRFLVQGLTAGGVK